MVTSLQSYQSQVKTLAQAPVPQDDLERKRQMADAWKAYRGEFAPPLKVEKDQPDLNVISNRCSPIVNKGVSFLFGQELKIEAPDQDAIDELWGDADDMMTMLSEMALNGGVTRQNFVKLIPAQGEMDAPRIVVMDPQIVRMVTLPNDCEIHVAFIIEYSEGETQKRQIIARVDPNSDLTATGEDDLEDTWTITNYVRSMGYGSWQQVGEPEEWPYPFPPIFTNKNLPNPNDAWGISDLTPDLIGVNKALNFTQSNTQAIIKFHAHPKTWGKGFKAAQLSVGVDDTLIIESLDGTLQNLEMHSDLASSRNFAADLRSDMDEQSRVPAVALGRETTLPRGNISGVALELLFQPLIEKTIQKQRLYGKLIREVSRAALVLAGRVSIANYKKYKVTLHWQDLLPMDDLAAAQTGPITEQLGVSKETVITRLGFDAKAEARKKAAEQQAQLQLQQQQMAAQGIQPGQPPFGGNQQQQGGQQQ